MNDHMTLPVRACFVAQSRAQENGKDPGADCRREMHGSGVRRDQEVTVLHKGCQFVTRCLPDEIQNPGL